MRNFRNPATASAFPDAGQSLQDLIDQIYWFAQLDSVFLPLSPKRLIWSLAKCFSLPSPDLLFCRRELVRTLSYTGHFEAAAEQLKALERDGREKLPARDLRDLRLYLESARRVR